MGLLPSSPEGPVAQGSDVQHRFTKQWRLKPLFLVDPTLASVLRESFEIITRLDLGVIFPQGLLFGKAAVSAIVILLSAIAFQRNKLGLS